MEQISQAAAAMKFKTPLPTEKQTLTVVDTASDCSCKKLAVGFSDGSVSIYSGEKFLNCEGHLGAHERSVIRLAWIGGLKHGHCFASTGLDNKVCIFRDVANFPPKEDNNISKPANWHKVFEYGGLPSVCPSIAWSPPQYGLIVAAACGDGQVAVFSSNTNNNANASNSPTNITEITWSTKIFPAHDHGCTAISWAPCLAPGSLLQLPLVQQQQQGGATTTASGSSSSGNTNTALSLPHPRLATGGKGERTVKIWKYFAADGEWALDHALNELPPQTSIIRDIAWSPNFVGLPFSYLAACTDEGNIIVWRQDGVEGIWQHCLIQTGRSGITNMPVARLHWSGAGTVLVSVWKDGTTSMWLEDGKGVFHLAAFQD